MKNLLAIISLSCAALHCASADTVQYNYTGETGGGVVIGLQTANYSGNALVGEFHMTTSNPSFNSSILTYCTDIGVDLNFNYNYTPTALSSATGVAPAWISGGIQNAAALWSADKGTSTTAIQTAGLQLAIWELLYNSTANAFTASTFYNHSNNGFYLTSDDANTLASVNYAASILGNIHSLATPGNVIWLAPTTPDGTTGGSQGLLYQTPGTTDVPHVPDTASTFALMGIAVSGLGMAARRIGISK